MTWYNVAALLILVICVIRGLQVGLIRSACGLLAVAAGIALASNGAELLSPSLADSLSSPIAGFLEETMMQTLGDAFGDAALDAIDSSEFLSSQEIISLLQALGLYDSVASAVNSAVSTTLAAVVPIAAEAIAVSLSESLAYAIIYLCIFALVLVIGRLLGSVLNLADHVPGIHILNRAGGAVFGFLKGLAIILAGWWLLYQLNFSSSPFEALSALT